MAIVITAVLGIAATLAAPFVYERLRPLIARLPIIRPRLSRSLKLDAARDVLIVYPPRDNTNPEPILPTITIEDFMGINHLQRLFASASWPQDKILLRDCEFWDQNATNAQQNLVLLCGPWRNRATKEALEGFSTLLTEAEISFEDVPQEPSTKARQMYFGQESISLEATPSIARQIRFLDGVWKSPTVDQIPELKKQNKPVAEGPLDDYALILSVPAGVWNDHGPVLVVAGLRGIGTWGACDHLRRHERQLRKKTGKKGFAMVVRVRYEKWDIFKKTKEIHFVAFN